MGDLPEGIDKGSGATLHVAPGAIQWAGCLFCGAILDENSHAGGKPQKFCLKKPCRRLYWQEARRIGGQVLRLRQARQTRVSQPRFRLTAVEGKRLAVLIAAGAMVTGFSLPGVNSEGGRAEGPHEEVIQRAN